MHDLSVLDKVVTTILYSNEKLNWETGTFDTSYLSNNYCYFELIEDNTIDIDSIEELTKRMKFNYDVEKYLYTKEITLTDKQKEALTYYKGAGFMKTNAFTRGNFDELEKKYNPPKTVENMVEKLLIIEEIAKGLPKRKYDIVLSRKGKGVGKSTEIGSENEYDSIVSFGTNEGTDMGNKSNTIYKRVLNKEEPCIPADLLLPEAVFIDRTECEIITLPFSYKVADYKKEENSRYQYITMGDIKEISLVDLIENRLKELGEYQKRKLEKIYETEKRLKEKTTSEREKDLKNLGYKEEEATDEQIELTDVFKEMSKTIYFYVSQG